MWLLNLLILYFGLEALVCVPYIFVNHDFTTVLVFLFSILLVVCGIKLRGILAPRFQSSSESVELNSVPQADVKKAVNLSTYYNRQQQKQEQAAKYDAEGHLCAFCARPLRWSDSPFDNEQGKEWHHACYWKERREAMRKATPTMVSLSRSSFYLWGKVYDVEHRDVIVPTIGAVASAVVGIWAFDPSMPLLGKFCAVLIFAFFGARVFRHRAVWIPTLIWLPFGIWWFHAGQQPGHKDTGVDFLMAGVSYLVLMDIFFHFIFELSRLGFRFGSSNEYPSERQIREHVGPDRQEWPPNG